MTEEVKSLPPKKDKSSWWYRTKVGGLIILDKILWLILLIVSMDILGYYVYCLITKGIFDEETLKYAIFLVIGIYFILILDKKKIYEALGIKNLPQIIEGKIEPGACAK